MSGTKEKRSNRACTRLEAQQLDTCFALNDDNKTTQGEPNAERFSSVSAPSFMAGQAAAVDDNGGYSYWFWPIRRWAANARSRWEIGVELSSQPANRAVEQTNKVMSVKSLSPSATRESTAVLVGNERDETSKRRAKKRRDVASYHRRTTLEELQAMGEEGETAPSSAGAVNIDNKITKFEEYDDDSSSSSLSTVGGLDDDDVDDYRSNEDNPEAEMLLSTYDKTSTAMSSIEITTATVKKEFDVSSYMSSREMTPMQERVNALTIVPNPFFSLYFLMAGKWLTEQAIASAREDLTSFIGKDSSDFDASADATDDWGASTLSSVGGGLGLSDNDGCIRSPLFPHLYALPPLPLIAVAFGITIHAPFSFIYHWSFAHRLPPGLPRIEHWSRRLDHAFIHIASALMSYATSGSWDYFLANLMYNLDCVYRQFKPKVRPRRNKIRIFISIVAYTIPVLRRGDISLFVQMWVILGTSGWLFAKYPIGGWSHAAFHLVIAFLPPLLMSAAVELPASQAQVQVAAKCAVYAGA